MELNCKSRHSNFPAQSNTQGLTGLDAPPPGGGWLAKTAPWSTENRSVLSRCPRKKAPAGWYLPGPHTSVNCAVAARERKGSGAALAQSHGKKCAWVVPSPALIAGQNRTPI